MRDEHIVSLIENAPLASFSESELAVIADHVESCADCRRAFAASQIAALLLKEHAGEVFEPSPFFHTRVMANLRERQTNSSTWALARLWRAAGAIASTMAATVAALAVLTFAIPGNQVTSNQPVSTLANNYSAEAVLLNQDETSEEQISDAQILSAIYDAEEEVVR